MIRTYYIYHTAQKKTITMSPSNQRNLVIYLGKFIGYPGGTKRREIPLCIRSNSVPAVVRNILPDVDPMQPRSDPDVYPDIWSMQGPIRANIHIM